MNKIRAVFIVSSVMVILGLYVPGIYAAQVLYDDFNTGSLNPAWTTALINVDNWTYSMSGGNLDVTGITQAEMNKYATVSLTRTFSSVQDFTVTSMFSWGSDNHSMQSFYLYLLDASDKKIATVGYTDGWFTSQGQQYADATYYAGSNSFSPGGHTLEDSGTANFLITRASNSINVSWNETSLVTGYTDTPLSKVLLVFQYYPYSNGSEQSTFGNESLDFIRVETPNVPVPAAVWLFGSGLVGLLGIRRKTAH